MTAAVLTQDAEPAKAPAPKRDAPLTLTVHPLSLAGLDTLGAKDLLLFVGEDERPLRGLTGLADWRLCGALTDMVRRSLFSGAPGETLLTVAGDRLPVERIFVVGLGKERPGTAIQRSLSVVAQAKGRDLALAPFPPGAQDLTPFTDEVASAAYAAGLSRLTLLAEQLQPARKALVVVESRHSWVRLENVL